MRNLFRNDVGTIVIDNVESFRYVGLVLEPSLTFNSHVNEICKKMNSKMFLLNRYKILFSTKDKWKKIFATSLVLSFSDYALSVWENLKESSLCRFYKK